MYFFSEVIKWHKLKVFIIIIYIKNLNVGESVSFPVKLWSEWVSKKGRNKQRRNEKEKCLFVCGFKGKQRKEWQERRKLFDKDMEQKWKLYFCFFCGEFLLTLCVGLKCKMYFAQQSNNQTIFILSFQFGKFLLNVSVISYTHIRPCLTMIFFEL
jgi:hypothetical protein